MQKAVADVLRLLSCISLIFQVFSCSEPMVSETFIKQSGREADGSYIFSLDLSDSLRSNTLYIYALIDAPESAFSRMPEELPLRIEAESPAGERYTETVAVPVDSFVNATKYSRQYESLYRSGFHPAQYGKWELSVKVLDEDRFIGFRGIGLKHIKREYTNGKR